MRCVVVNGAKLKADTCCSSCRRQIGESYIRDIGTRRVYCDYACYHDAGQAPAVTFEYRRRLASPGTLRS